MNQKHSEHVGPYRKSNAFSKKPSLAMLLTLAVMAAIITLHALIINSITAIDSAILSVMMGFNYVTLCVVAVDYFILLAVDPVDPRLLSNFVEREKDRRLLVYCSACRKHVHIYSYHCKVCDRCADEFDHHCIFLNNCIGRKNYANFFRVLLSLTLHLLITIGEGIWVAVIETDWQRWLAVALCVVAGLVLPEVVGLMAFHCYISLFLYKTTLQYIRGDIDSEQRDNMEEYQPGGIKKVKKTEQKIETETSINRNQNF